MHALDLFFHIGNTFLLVLLAAVLTRNNPHKPSALLGAVVALGIAAMAMVSISLEWSWTALEIPLNLLCTTFPLAFWLLSKSLFEDSFRWKWFYLHLYLLLVASGIVGHYITFGDFRGYIHWVIRTNVAYHGFGLVPFVLMASVLVGLALYVALKDWRIDLVESRRRARMMSVSIGAIVTLFVTFTEYLNLGAPRSNLVDASVSGVFFLIIFGICTRSFGFNNSQLTQPVSFAFPSAKSEKAGAGEDIQGEAVIAELTRLMEEEKIYREEDLTIRRLAQRLGVKEYILRRLINGYLGHRNFNSFLNLYRIDEVARQLIEPATRHLPVLSIALDNGYRSMSPFNKAFREIKGMTPTEFRNQNMSGRISFNFR